jgi:triphosphoribosyl-dephospho-CoA synthase
MATAQAFDSAAGPENQAALDAWDDTLKATGINPGTSADLTVVTLHLALLWLPWHGS